jgi:signal transducing adaptor molecule
VRKRALGLIAEWAGEFENDETLGIMEDCYNNLKAKSLSINYTYPSSLLTLALNKDYKFDQPLEPPPPTIDDEIRRKEEEELQRVLEMSKQDLGGRSRWTEFSLASSSGAGPSGSGCWWWPKFIPNVI